MTDTLAQPSMRLPEELVSSTLFLLKKLGFKAKEASAEAYEAFGLHPYHHAILSVLDRGSTETQGAIADTLGYDKGQLVGLLDELEKDGYIERRRDQTDRRRQTVEITPEGRKALQQLRRLAGRLEEDFLAGLSPQEREDLHTLLLRLGQQHMPQCRVAAPPPRP